MALALGDEVVALLGERERIDLDEEAHRRDRPRREPALDQRVDLEPRRVPGRELADRQLAHGDALRARAAQLLAQALALLDDRRPVVGRPDRLVADPQRRPAGELGEPRLGPEAADPPTGFCGRGQEPRTASATRSCGAIGGPATTHALPVST